MNDLPELYFTMETYLFPILEEGIGEITTRMKDFLRIVEMFKLSRFINNTLHWCGWGRPMKNRAKCYAHFPKSRVNEHWEVLCHLISGVIAIAINKLFNMLE